MEGCTTIRYLHSLETKERQRQADIWGMGVLRTSMQTSIEAQLDYRQLSMLLTVAKKVFAVCPLGLRSQGYAPLIQPFIFLYLHIFKLRTLKPLLFGSGCSGRRGLFRRTAVCMKPATRSPIFKPPERDVNLMTRSGTVQTVVHTVHDCVL